VDCIQDLPGRKFYCIAFGISDADENGQQLESVRAWGLFSIIFRVAGVRAQVFIPDSFFSLLLLALVNLNYYFVIHNGKMK